VMMKTCPVIPKNPCPSIFKSFRKGSQTRLGVAGTFDVFPVTEMDVHPEAYKTTCEQSTELVYVMLEVPHRMSQFQTFETQTALRNPNSRNNE
jgi:hypothetical protein